jgi:hypothetical protein
MASNNGKLTSYSQPYSDKTEEFIADDVTNGAALGEHSVIYWMSCQKRSRQCITITIFS